MKNEGCKCKITPLCCKVFSLDTHYLLPVTIIRIRENMHRFTCTSQKFHKEGVFISRERYRTQMLLSLAQSHTTFPGGSDLKPDPSDYVVSGMFHCYVGNDNNMAQGHCVPSHTCDGCQKLIMTFLCGATLGTPSG